MWCWGNNEFSQVGPDAGAAVDVPVQFESDADWTAIAIAGATNCGLRDDGTAWCWGSNRNGEVGNGESGRDLLVASATMVGDIGDWISLSGGQTTMCGVRSDGTALCWGTNTSGQQGNDTVFDSGTPREVRDDG
jgi:alpha-tubulin suppressor-like RCC1 family protein